MRRRQINLGTKIVPKIRPAPTASGDRFQWRRNALEGVANLLPEPLAFP
jgi:hypothetical protein